MFPIVNIGCLNRCHDHDHGSGDSPSVLRWRGLQFVFPFEDLACMWHMHRCFASCRAGSKWSKDTAKDCNRDRPGSDTVETRHASSTCIARRRALSLLRLPFTVCFVAYAFLAENFKNRTTGTVSKGFLCFLKLLRVRKRFMREHAGVMLWPCSKLAHAGCDITTRGEITRD